MVSLEEDRQDLLLGAGLSLLYKNKKRDSRGVAYGGVAIFFKKDICNFKPVNIGGGDDLEILIAAGSMRGHSRKIFVIACYMPPNYNGQKANSCLDYIEGAIIEVKRRFKDPYIIVSGDFNQWDVLRAVKEFLDISETSAGPTRGNRTIDRTFSNLENIKRKGVLDPLQSDDEINTRQSDHRIFYVTAAMKFKWLNYSYRYKSKEACEEFEQWILNKDWSGVLSAVGSDPKADLYQAELNAALESIFPLCTIKRRNVDPVSYTHLTLPTTPYV